MGANGRFWNVFYDSVMAIVGGAAAAIVYASFSESQFVTFGASLALLGMLIVLGYVINGQIPEESKE